MTQQRRREAWFHGGAPKNGSAVRRSKTGRRGERRGSLLVNDDMRLHVEYRPITKLRVLLGHARDHSASKLDKLCACIRELGLVTPLLVDGHDQVIAGHARLKAAQLLGMDEVPVIAVQHLNEQQVRALRIADNRLVELGTWDHELLALEFETLLDFKIDLELTGFEASEIDAVWAEVRNLNEGSEAEHAPDIPSGPVVSIPGDLWVMEVHRVLCGDALNPAVYGALGCDGRVAMVFSDPPYNRPAREIGGRGKIRHPDFQMASGEMTDGDFAVFLGQALRNFHAVLKSGALIYLCMDWRSASVLDVVARQLFVPVNWCIWDKVNPGMGSFYRSQFEIVQVYRHGRQGHRHNVKLGRFGRNRSNVWRYPGVIGFGADKRAELRDHPTPKPVAMIADAILDATAPGELVLDCFLGAGATLIACERTRRICAGVEIDPRYVDAAVLRWQRETGGTAVCARSRRSFAEVAEERLNRRRLLPPPTLAGKDRLS